jgi:AcrR family transcriptional regulator
MTGRAAPLPPDQRRDAIIDAMLPLLRQHGAAVSTRQIADAAGIAEGTIFRAFGDKQTLIEACVARLFAVEPTLAKFAALDPSTALEVRVGAALDILCERIASAWVVLASLSSEERWQGLRKGNPGLSGNVDALVSGLAKLFVNDIDVLRCPPDRAARIITTVAFASFHPRIRESNVLRREEIVDLITHGIGAAAC